MKTSMLVRELWQLYRREFVCFIPGALLLAILVSAGGRLLLVIPFGLSLLVWAAVRSLRLARFPTFKWWIERASQYWLMHLFVVLSTMGVVLAVIIGADWSGAPMLEDPTGLFLSSALFLVLSFYLLLRLWPLLVAAYLVEGVMFYQNPLYPYLLWIRSPLWLGPGILRASRWSAHPRVARSLTPYVALGMLLVVALIFAAWSLFADHGFLRTVALFVIFLWGLGPVLLFTTAAGWIAALLAGETPPVIESAQIPEVDEELHALQEVLRADRVFVNRFPGDEQSYWKLVLPSAVVRARRDELLEEIAAVGTTRRWHNGEYLEIWSERAQCQGDLEPDILVDLQNAVLAVVVRAPGSPAHQKLSVLFSEWRTRFPVDGNEF